MVMPTHSYVHPKWMEPYFDPSTPLNVTALMGKSAYLSCRVRNLGNKTVSWIRHRDIHILTVGSYTYTSDQRFQATYHQDNDDWTLQIKWAQKRDAGMYECQISTQPVRSYFVRLNVVVPTATILGGPDLHVDKGSTINLTCTVKFSPEPPAYIFWYHHEEVINYDSSRGGVSVITEKGDVTTSFLLIQNADLADSGKYSCAPSNADVASVRVHVLNVRPIISGEHPEAMQTGTTGSQFSCLTMILFVALVFSYNQQQCSNLKRTLVLINITKTNGKDNEKVLKCETETETATIGGNKDETEAKSATKTMEKISEKQQNLPDCKNEPDDDDDGDDDDFGCDDGKDIISEKEMILAQDFNGMALTFGINALKDSSPSLMYVAASYTKSSKGRPQDEAFTKGNHQNCIDWRNLRKLTKTYHQSLVGYNCRPNFDLKQDDENLLAIESKVSTKAFPSLESNSQINLQKSFFHLTEKKSNYETSTSIGLSRNTSNKSKVSINDLPETCPNYFQRNSR